MELKNLNVYFFFLVLILVSSVAFMLLVPFWTSIVMAAVLAIIFQKPYNFFLRIFRDKKWIASLSTCLLVMLVVIAPLFFLVNSIVSELNSFYQIAVSGNGLLQNYIDWKNSHENVASFFNTFRFDQLLTQENITNSFKNFSQGIFSIVQTVYQGIVGAILWALVTLLTFFFFLVEGKNLIRRVMDLSPLRDKYEAVLIKKFVSISKATLKGTVIVGMVQGFLGGILFAVAGIPSPVIWGIVMAIFSLVPMIGTGIIWFPAGIIMLALGNVWQGVLILAVGFSVISTADNVIRAKLVGRDSEMHPLLVFFASLGGLSLFGASGIIIGPIIMALFLAFWDIYAIEFGHQLNEFNK